MTDKIVVFSSCGSEEEAAQIAHRLVEERLAACVNIVAPIRSFYRWEGRIESAHEWLLLIKTSRRVLVRMRRVLETAHSYELPEVLALPVLDGSPQYLAWLERELIAEENSDLA